LTENIPYLVGSILEWAWFNEWDLWLWMGRIGRRVRWRFIGLLRWGDLRIVWLGTIYRDSISHMLKSQQGERQAASYAAIRSGSDTLMQLWHTTNYSRRNEHQYECNCVVHQNKLEIQMRKKCNRKHYWIS
jgi:hypothetical protein